jgi:hypothetical protein
VLAERGQHTATEAEITQAAADLLDTAEQGPPDKPEATRQDRKVAGRTRATAPATWARPLPDDPPSGIEDAHEPDEDLAAVIPLPVFDAREEAKRWW